MPKYPEQFTPLTACHICRTGLNPTDKDYYLALTPAAYNGWIVGQAIDSATNFTVINAHGIIRYPGNADELIKAGADYVAWINRNYDSKWWYAYITSIVYKNPNVAEIHFEVDVVSTFLYNITIGSQYLLRETVKNDDWAMHLQDEGFSINDYVYSKWKHPVITEPNRGGRLDRFSTAVAGYWVAGDWFAGTYDGVPYLGKIGAYSDTAELSNVVGQFENNQDDAKLHAIYAIPRFVAGNGNGFLSGDDHDNIVTAEFNVMQYTPGFAWEPAYPADGAGGWAPNNYKLYSYPYTALYVTNGNDASQMLRFEHFLSGQINFVIYANHIYPVTPVMYPCRYEHSAGYKHDINVKYALPLGELPMLGYSMDAYAQWAATQSSALKMQAATTILSGAIGFVSAKFGGSPATARSVASSVVGSVISQGGHMAVQDNLAQHTPDTVNFGNSGGMSYLTVGSDNYGPTFAIAQCPQYMAKKYDDYFSLYGYTANYVSNIDLFGSRRPLFDYYQTIDCHIDCNIPVEYSSKIESLFDSGIRFWYNPDKVGDYSDANLKENSLH